MSSATSDIARLQAVLSTATAAQGAAETALAAVTQELADVRNLRTELEQQLARLPV